MTDEEKAAYEAATERLDRRLAMSHDAARFEARRLATFRDDIESKILFGLLSLNAGSAVALPTLFNALGTKAVALGLQTPLVLSATVAFMVGAWVSGYALRAYNILLINEASRYAQLEHHRARALHAAADPRGEAEFQDAQACLKEIKSKSADRVVDLESIAGGLWGIGVISVAIDLIDGPFIATFKNFVLWIAENTGP